MRQHLAGVLHEDAQQLVFLGRELYLRILDPHDAPHQIDGQIADLENRPLSLGLELMPHRRSHAGRELLHSERLGHIVVGAKVQRLDL